MAAVAKGSVAGLFATAKPNRAAFLIFPGDGLEGRSFMASIAKGLFDGKSAGTPGILLALLRLYGEGGFLSDICFSQFLTP